MGEGGGGATHRNRSEGCLDFLRTANKLKRTEREGWVRSGIRPAESVADHSHGVALMALVAAREEGVDPSRCAQLAVVHDVAEALVGDITPGDNVATEDKRAREEAALDRMASGLPSQSRGEVEELWREFEEGQTGEAALVRDMDKVEMGLQAEAYEEEREMDLSPFFKSMEEQVQTATGKEWARCILARRSGG